MSFLYQLILFALFNPLHSLKLLAAGDDDSSKDMAASNLPEESEQWEADIAFSYKPLAGKCKEVGKFVLLSKAGGGEAGYTASAKGKTDKDGVGCTEKCAGSAADVKKWCTITGKEKFNEVMDVWMKAVTTNTKQCVTNLAKLYSMANAVAKCKDNPVTAFDLKVTDCTAARAFKSSDGGKPVTSVAADGYLCYAAAGITWAKNDPIVKNMDGEEFEILSTGTFMLLSLQQKDSEKINLEVLSTIDRAGTRCGATYIQNITLQGQWVEEEGVPQIQVRAVSAVPKSQALEINFDGAWKPANSHWTYNSVKKASTTQFHLTLRGVKILVGVDSHRIHEAGVKTNRFANFLNVNFEGVFRLSGMSVRGLLGRDSHVEASEPPAECRSSLLLSSDEGRMLSSAMLSSETP